MQPICQHSQLHAVAQQLVRISSVAAEIYQDQMDLVGHFTSQNMFRIDPYTASCRITEMVCLVLNFIRQNRIHI